MTKDVETFEKHPCVGCVERSDGYATPPGCQACKKLEAWEAKHG